MPPDRPAPDRPATGPAGVPAVRPLLALVVLVIGIGTVALVLLGPVLETGFSGLALFAGVLVAFLLAYRWRLHRDRAFLATWAALSLALAVYSIVTGRFNGLTDEPYATPAFVRILPNLYGQTIHLTYTQYGTPQSLTSAYVYLPLLTLLQVPGVSYRWISVGAWGATVYLTRRNGPAVLLFGSPFTAVIAANGFNDFVPLLALTLTFVTLTGTRSRVAEVIALGLKQLANVIVVVYHLWHRRWREALIAVGVTAAFLVPFAVLAPEGVVCRAILVGSLPSCFPGSSNNPVTHGTWQHLNYYVWALWLLAIFGARYVAELRGPAYAEERTALARWRRKPPLSPESQAPAPSVPAASLLLLPFVRVVLWWRRPRRHPRPG